MFSKSNVNSLNLSNLVFKYQSRVNSEVNLISDKLEGLTELTLGKLV